MHLDFTGMIGIEREERNIETIALHYGLRAESGPVRRDMIWVLVVALFAERGNGRDVVLVHEGDDHNSHEVTVISRVPAGELTVG